MTETTSVFQCPILSKIDEAIDRAVDKPRGHLGMSGIAGDARTLWLNFRWCLPDDAAPRTRRIWALGHAIEAEIVRYLKLAGFELYADDGGSQFGFKFLGGHYAGSMDGVIRGLPQSTQWHVMEAKSVKASRFKELKKVGVKEWDPVYYGQMQCYMGAANLKRALFVAYNKDTSELYFERVNFDPQYYAAMMVKAEEIITGDIPLSTFNGRTDYRVKKFKQEQWQRVYWGDELPENVNCRNCRHAVADTKGTGAAWGCMLHKRQLTIDEQLAGCDHHNFIPSLVPGEVVSTSSESVTYRVKGGAELTNGPEKFSSREISQLSRVDFDNEVLSQHCELVNVFGDGVEVESAVPWENEKDHDEEKYAEPWREKPATADEN